MPGSLNIPDDVDVAVNSTLAKEPEEVYPTGDGPQPQAHETREISVVIPVTDRADNVEGTYLSYKSNLEATDLSFDVTYVLDGELPQIRAALERLVARGEPIKIITLLRWFGEATALAIGSSQCSGKFILTLPAYLQVDPAEIPRFVAARGDLDLLVATRDRISDSTVNRWQWRAFHFLLSALLQSKFKDLGCGMRLLKREVLEEIRIYADQHRFLPLLAEQHGFRVGQLVVRQAESDTKRRVYPLGTYHRRVLDILSIYFLLKFTRKPFRFFGLIGLAIGFCGVLLALSIVIDRFFYGVPISDRPLMVLSALLGVIGVQFVAMGLIGEIVIYTRSRGATDYWVEKSIGKDK